VIGVVGGLAILSHIVVEREKFHSAILTENIAAADPNSAQRLGSLSRGFARFSTDTSRAQDSAYAALDGATSGQAFTLAFADAFTFSAIALALSAILVWMLPRIPAEVAPSSFKRSKIA